MSYQPFWFDKALDEEEATALLPKLPPNHHTDICIIGGGFTGLWTAIQIKQQQPTKNVTIIEQDLCGQGASGRNGGAMLTWSTKLPSLIKLVGLENALFLAKESEQAVHSIKQFTKEHAIDCDCRVDGCFYTASNLAQQGLLQPSMHSLTLHNANNWQVCDKQQLLETGSAANLSGYYSPHGGSIQPAKLVRGLKKVAEKLQVTIIEQCAYKTHSGQEPINIDTTQGQLNAQSMIFAVNAWLPSLQKQFAKKVVLVSSDMAITPPLPELLKRRKLTHGAPVIDSRIFVNYYRTTSDHRLMLGKGGNYFSFANKVSAKFDEPSRYSDLLQYSLRHFFQTDDVPIERTWTGPSDRSVSGFPFFGQFNDGSPVYYGSGYSGNGIVQSYLGGKILASLVLGSDPQWSKCGLVNTPIANFPSEPFRSIGAYTIRNAIRRKERTEDRNQQPYKLDIMLAKLSGSAAKVDIK
ncbi:FAD-dependent oxidoreductase [Pseudoalteromonas arctica]|uniref:FAD-dependent oxidoreductase n=1 Tax=Pseudoalteromonas arctica TaxID=394751 RepID=A0A7Y0DUG9_9GAMM|nr:FAD-dependent oxidoreductase [Pseudoalteromonas arctica]NMM41801.1 FAD-dependent oxidoreductase [Pseudoalteromonas arctica]